MQLRVVAGSCAVFAALAAVAIMTFQSNRELYFTVDEVAARGWIEPVATDTAMVVATLATTAARGGAGDEAAGTRVWQVRGTVDHATVARGEGGSGLTFELVGGAARMPVAYRGVIPDSFEQAVTVTVAGRLAPDGVFVADRMTAQCPSKYQPAAPPVGTSTEPARPAPAR